ncbi:MAG: NADH-quinone oxidoreductase subunit A [Myxococcota bacterium]
MTNPYVAVLLTIVIAVVFSVIFVNGSRLLGRAAPEPEKNDVYECGVPPIGSARARISVKFYMVAILFILFDLEAVFLLPWAVTLKDFVASGMGMFVLIEMFVFLGLLFLGWLYVLKRGALKWD